MKLSRGAIRCLARLLWYARRYKRVHPTQQKLAVGLEVSDRQVRTYLAELRGNGLVSVHQGGNGRAALYSLTSGLTSGLLPGCFPVPYSEPSINDVVMVENFRAVEPQLSSVLQYKSKLAMPARTIQNEYGRECPNPEFYRIRGILENANERIRRARNPAAYERAILERELGPKRKYPYSQLAQAKAVG